MTGKEPVNLVSTAQYSKAGTSRPSVAVLDLFELHCMRLWSYEPKDQGAMWPKFEDLVPRFHFRKAWADAEAQSRDKLLEITPPNRFEDPFIAATLLALAQGCQREEKKGERGQAGIASAVGAGEMPCTAVHLIVVSRDPRHGDWAHIYTAQIPIDFLRKLNSASHPAAACEAFRITYTALGASMGKDFLEVLKARLAALRR